VSHTFLTGALITTENLILSILHPLLVNIKMNKNNIPVQIQKGVYASDQQGQCGKKTGIFIPLPLFYFGFFLLAHFASTLRSLREHAFLPW